MEHFHYHVRDEELIEELDKEFMAVNLIGEPEDGLSPGFNLSIYDPRDNQKVLEKIAEITMELEAEV